MGIKDNCLKYSQYNIKNGPPVMFFFSRLDLVVSRLSEEKQGGIVFVFPWFVVPFDRGDLVCLSLVCGSFRQG